MTFRHPDLLGQPPKKMPAEPPFRPGPADTDGESIPTSDAFRPRPPDASDRPRSPDRDPSVLRGRVFAPLRIVYQRG